MKYTHQFDPLMRVAPMDKDIRTYGCYQLSINFMLKPDGVVTQEELTKLIAEMTKAACDVIDVHNKKEDECPILSDTPAAVVDTKLSNGQPEKSSPGLIV